MNWLQFVASLVASLAWPATVAIGIFLLRVPLVRALFTLTRLRYKGLELDFGREVKQLEAQAKAIDIRPEQPRSIAAKRRDSAQLLEEAARLVRDFPEPAVALAWQAIEGELTSAVMRLAISPDFPLDNSARKNMEILRTQGVIDEDMFDLLNRMRVLRNMAVHPSQRVVPISPEAAAEFLALAGGVLDKLQALKRE